MKKYISKYINEFFNKLIDVFGFKVKRELEDGQAYLVEFSSKDYVIKIEKYFREFYVSVYALNDSTNEINLFNLLEFLKESDTSIPQSNYFRNEKSLEESYLKQLSHISENILNNIDLITKFFTKKEYESNLNKFDKYWRKKHPELY